MGLHPTSQFGYLKRAKLAISVACAPEWIGHSIGRLANGQSGLIHRFRLNGNVRRARSVHGSNGWRVLCRWVSGRHICLSRERCAGKSSRLRPSLPFASKPRLPRLEMIDLPLSRCRRMNMVASVGRPVLHNVATRKCDVETRLAEIHLSQAFFPTRQRSAHLPAYR
jgi:hypothetical protein